MTLCLVGVSYTHTHTHTVCFQVFTRDCNGFLSCEQFTRVVALLLRIREENTPPQSSDSQDETGKDKEEEEEEARNGTQVCV